jgi:hypothetical protein
MYNSLSDRTEAFRKLLVEKCFTDLVCLMHAKIANEGVNIKQDNQISRENQNF